MRRHALLFFVGIFALNASTANAFYWRDWPGSGLAATSSSSTSTTITTTAATVTTQSVVTNDPVDVVQTSDPGTTANTPEPSTLIGGLIGLGCLVMWRRSKYPYAAIRTGFDR